MILIVSFIFIAEMSSKLNSISNRLNDHLATKLTRQTSYSPTGSFDTDLPRKIHSPREMHSPRELEQFHHEMNVGFHTSEDEPLHQGDIDNEQQLEKLHHEMNVGFHTSKDESLHQGHIDNERQLEQLHHMMRNDGQFNHHHHHHMQGHPSTIIPNVGLKHRQQQQHQPIHKRILNGNINQQHMFEQKHFNTQLHRDLDQSQQPFGMLQQQQQQQQQQPLEMFHQQTRQHHQQQRNNNQSPLFGKQALTRTTLNDDSQQIFQGRMSLQGAPSITNNNSNKRSSGKPKTKLSSLNGAPSLSGRW